MQYPRFKKTPLSAGIAVALGAMTMSPALAQDSSDEVIEEIITTGIRKSQMDSVNLKRDAKGIMDGISATDLGKLPDVTVADSLQRIPGIQIQRSAGEGAFVNIRGLPQVRTLLNGEQFLTSGNIGTAQPNLTDIPSQLINGVDVYKSASLKNKRSGLTGTIDLKTWRPLDMDEGFTSSIAAELSSGDETDEGDFNVNGLINWNNGTVGVMVAAVSSESNLGNNFAGTGGGVFGSQDWGTNFPNPDTWLVPHGFEAFNRVFERERDGVNAAFQMEFGDGFTLTAETFYTEMTEHDRKVGINVSNRWIGLDYLTPSSSSQTGIQGAQDWTGSNWVSVDQYDVDAWWINSFTVNRTATSESLHNNLELEYNADNWVVRARYINDSADRLSMNGQSQGDLSNWSGAQTYGLPSGGSPFYPANVCANYDASRVTVVGDSGGCLIDANPLGYGEDPQLTYNTAGGHPVWGGFDTPIAGGLGAGATLRDYMANVGSYAIGAFSSEGNNENSADNEIFSLDGSYFFDDKVLDFFTDVTGGVRGSTRDASVLNFHLFSDFYAGNGATDPGGCAAQWKAIDVLMNQPPCTAGELVGGVFQPYTVNPPTGIDDFNNIVFVDNYGGQTVGLPGVWAADPRDYDDVVSFHQRVFGGANRVSLPGQSYDVSLDEMSYFIEAGFEIGDTVTGTVGLRYIDTEILTKQNEVDDVNLPYGDTQRDIGDTFSTSSYSDSLPAFNVAYRPTEELAIRAGYSQNMMAHDLGTYGGALKVNTVACTDPTILGGRCVSSANEGGNPFIKPWRTDNYDVSVEYYVGDASMFSVGYFRVNIESFTSGGTRKGSFPDSDGVIRREVDVSTTILGEGGEIEGVEVASRVAFSDFTDGFLRDFGLDVNYTHAPSDSNDVNGAGDPLPFPDNSEEQYNVVAWFQNDSWEARLAYNHRSERYTGKQAGVPSFQDAASYLDAQVTYHVNDDITVYLNGSNMTGEIEDYYFDFGAGPTQYWQQNEFEARYTIGVRARFDR